MKSALDARLEIWLQKASENRLIVFLAVAFYALRGLLSRLTGRRTRAWELLSQVHRTSPSGTITRAVEPILIRDRDAVWDRWGQPDRAEVERLLGIRLLVTKAPSGEEKGVVFVKFSETIDLVARTLDLSALLRDYHLVVEPSWSGYCDRTFFHFTQFDEPVFVMAPRAEDYRLIAATESNLVPIRCGPSDWVDPRIAEPYLDQPKRFDLVFNSNWLKLKRHYVLFSMLARLERKIDVVLIGARMADRTEGDIRKLAARYGVLDQLTFVEGIQFEEVMRINCQSRMAMLLSLKEGSNRAIAESLFCDIPAIVLEEHVGGITKNIVPDTGEIVPERRLGAGVLDVLDNLDRYRPRAWALENISCFVTSRLVNDTVRAEAVRRGEPWSRDIAPKTNSPEMRFIHPEDEQRLAGAHRELTRYLL